MSTSGKSKTTAKGAGGALLAFLLALVASLALSGNALAEPDEGVGTSEPSPAAAAPAPTVPSLWTGKDDYVPTEYVDIYGAVWQPGESVDIFVNDDEGRTWNHSATVTADELGAFVYEFRLPDWFVANYSVTATGAQTGTLRTEFADSIAQGSHSTNSNSGNGAASEQLTLSVPAIAAGEVAVAQIVVNKDFQTRLICPPAGWTSILRTVRNAGVYVQETFIRTTAAAAQSQDWQLRTGNCSTGALQRGFGASGGVIVYSGVDIANPIRSAFGTSGPSNDPKDAPGTGAAVAGDMVLRFFGNEKNETIGPAASNVYSIGSANQQPRAAAAFAATHTTGATAGTFTFTGSTGEWTAQSVVLRMAAPANVAPIANNDAYSTNEDTTLNVAAPGVLGNDVDVDSITVATPRPISSPTNGSLTLNADGSFEYVPNANFNGTDTFTYKAIDGSLESNVATVTITVNALNDDPNAVADSATVAEDSGANAIDVLANDDDGADSGETLSVTAVTQGANGSVAFTASGVEYTPNADFFGSDSFTYTISDGNGGSDTASVDVEVTSVNDDPVATDDQAELAEDSSANAIDVLANDNDGVDSGETLSVTAVTQGANGSVTFTAAGVSYTPNPNFFGSDSFTYTISDGNGGTATATVAVTVTEVNDAPSAGADSKSVLEDGVLSFFAGDLVANDSAGPANESGQSLTVTAVTATAGTHGTVSLDAGQVTYTPDADYNGPASFEYTLEDDGTTNGAADPMQATGTVNVTVTEVNDTPDAVNDAADVAEDSAAGVLVDVLANDSAGPANESGQSLTITSVGSPSHGTAVLEAGKIRYTPTEAGYNGSDSFTYTMEDDGTTNGVLDEKSDIGTVSITVSEVNDAPVAVDDSAGSVAEDGELGFAAADLTSNDDKGAANESGQSLTVTAVTATAGTHGTVSLDGGQVTYTPAADYNGPASFSYTVEDDGTTDGEADFKSDSATVSLTVTEVNDAPDAVNDAAEVAEDGSLVFPASDLADNDSAGPANESGQSLTVTAVTATAGTHGTVSLDGGQVTYTPAVDYYGPASFEYTVEDNGTTNGAADPKSDTASVSVTVSEVNDAPVADDDADTVAEDSATGVLVDVLANDSEGPANESDQSLTITSVSSPSHGTAVVEAGKIRYTPTEANYNGPDSFTYTTTDDGTTDGAADPKSDTATVSITVTPVNDAPTVTADNATVNVDEGQTAQNTGDWADVDLGDDVTLTASIGTVVENADGTWSWSFATNDSDQSDTVTITADDGEATATATFSLVVTNLNPTVTITSPTVGTLYTVGSTVNVSASFGDLGTGDTHTCVISWDNGLGTTNGTVTEANGSGTCTDSRQLTAGGVYTIRVTVTDDDGGAGFDETIVVVYDPNVGHVTGGGWINSPAGAYRDNLALEGRANFGFNAKYLKGAKTPSGSTEFQFKAGSLNFHSSNYEWLVVSGAKGQFKGTGTINGGGNYGFLLTVTDGQLSGGGGTDKFRIKIWHKNAADAIVYDNADADGDDIDSSSTQEIAGGSIVIHKGK